MNPMLDIGADLWYTIVMKLTLGAPILRLTCKSFATLVKNWLTHDQTVSFSYYSALMAWREKPNREREFLLAHWAEMIVLFRMFHVYAELTTWTGHVHHRVAREWERECAHMLVHERDDDVAAKFVRQVVTLPNINLAKRIFIDDIRSVVPMMTAVQRGSISLVAVLLMDKRVRNNVHTIPQFSVVSVYGKATSCWEFMRWQQDDGGASTYKCILDLLAKMPGAPS